MDLLKRLDPLWIALLIVGGLNWAIIALFDTAQSDADILANLAYLRATYGPAIGIETLATVASRLTSTVIGSYMRPLASARCRSWSIAASGDTPRSAYKVNARP